MEQPARRPTGYSRRSSPVWCEDPETLRILKERSSCAGLWPTEGARRLRDRRATRCRAGQVLCTGDETRETSLSLKIPIRNYLASILPGLADLPVRRVVELTPTAWAARS